MGARTTDGTDGEAIMCGMSGVWGARLSWIRPHLASSVLASTLLL